MVSRPSRRAVNPSQSAAPGSIDPESMPPPMRRAYERYRQPEGPRHRPKGNGAHIYARVSSEEQAGTGKTSLDEQIRHCEKALIGTGIPVVATWRDEGFSGVSRFSERPVGRELFKLVKAGQIVVSYRVDRFSRNALFGLDDINELRRRGVGLLIAGDNRWISPAHDELDPVDEFNLQQGIIVAQLERGMIVSRTEAGRRNLLERGYWPWSVAPSGYRREHDGIGYKLVTDENEQKVLALMRRGHQRGASAPQITAALNEAGFRNRRGVPFESSAVYNAMRKNGIVQPKTRSPGGAKSNSAKPNGNPTIGAASSCGVSSVLQQKIRDAERVGPIIAHLISQQGCTSLRKLADALNYLEVETPRCKDWHPSSVKNAMSVLNMTIGGVHGDKVPEQMRIVGGLPVRPDRDERLAIRRRYGLPGKSRGRVQRATPDILFMRDQGITPDSIARVLALSTKGVKAVLKRYPRWEIDDPAVIEQVLARHASGERDRKIARTLGLELQQVRRLIALRRVKRRRDRLPPLAADRRAGILTLRRQGKTGPEIYAAFGVETQQERQQIRRFLQQQARREPALALRNPPTLADEIATAKSEAKQPEDYIRQDDYYLLRYWAEKSASPPSPEVVRVAELLQEGQPIAEIVGRTGLTRNRVKYIRSALQSGRMRVEGLAASPGVSG
jgi:DNA invertase Pin-like site-specific DNA recombinase